MSKTSKSTYLKLARQTIEAIGRLPKTEENRPAFNRLKKKLAKYVEKAKQNQ